MKNPNLNVSTDLAYILGVLKGDGCVTKHIKCSAQNSIVLNVTDIKFAKSFASSLKNIDLNPTVFSIKKRKNQIRVRAFSIMFSKWYNSLNLERIEEMLTDKRHIIAFIRGYYESEGCINQSRKYPRCHQLTMYNTNQKLQQMVHRFTKEVGFNFKIYHYERSNRKLIYLLKLYKQKEISRFLEKITPCIKNGLLERRMSING